MPVVLATQVDIQRLLEACPDLCARRHLINGRLRSLQIEVGYAGDLHRLLWLAEAARHAEDPDELQKSENGISVMFDHYSLNHPSSKIAYLVSHAHKALADGYRKLQWPFLARWHEAISSVFSPNGTPGKNRSALNAHQDVRLGRPPHAVASLTQLRYKGHLLEHRAIQMEMLQNGQHVAAYEAFAAECQLSGNPEQALKSVGLRELVSSDMESRALIPLWFRVLSPRKLIPRAVERMASPGDSLFWNGVKAASPLRMTLHRMGNYLDDLTTEPVSEGNMLRLAACLRWCEVKRMDEFVTLLQEAYQAFSLQIGNRLDVLDVFDPLQYAGKLSSEELVEHGWARTATTARMTTMLCSELGIQAFRRLFSSASEVKRLDQESRERLAAILVRHLSALRGPLMKVGQTASYLGLDIGEELPMRNLSAAGVATPFVDVLSQLQEDLTKDQWNLIAHVERNPVGVGSVAQVHRGTLRDGRTVAIKVVHPGIEEAITSDMALLRVAAPVLKLFVPRMNVGALLDELQAGLIAETDLKREASHLDYFRCLFAASPWVSFPEVAHELCTSRTLVTEFIDGQPLLEFLQSSDEMQRQHITEAVLRFVVGSCRSGMFNTDLHMGNFLVRQGKLVAIDFGNVKKLSPIMAKTWCDAIRVCAFDDRALFSQVVSRLGLVAHHRLFDEDLAYDVHMGHAMDAVKQDREQSYSYEVIHQELKTMFSAANRNLRYMSLHPEFVYAFRVYFGLFSMLAAAGGSLNWKRLCQEILA